MMIAVAASGVVLAVFALQQVPPETGLAVGTVVSLTFIGIAALARGTRDLCSAPAAAVAGVLVAVPLLLPCTPIGIIAGPIVGLLVRIATRPPSGVPPGRRRSAEAYRGIKIQEVGSDL
jgi:hypothetical protein